jgi:hypothetical protein
MPDSEIISLLRPVGLPLPSVSIGQGLLQTWVCAVSPMGAKGRISDSFCIRELGWLPATPIRVTVTLGKVVVMRAAEHSERPIFNSEQRLDVSGHLRLLTTTCRVAGFSIGERLLLIADLDGEVLHIMTTKMLSRFVNPGQTHVSRGARQDG